MVEGGLGADFQETTFQGSLKGFHYAQSFTTGEDFVINPPSL
jgi:hypothetical protein